MQPVEPKIKSTYQADPPRLKKITKIVMLKQKVKQQSVLKKQYPLSLSNSFECDKGCFLIMKKI
ncbi:hypothetical protein LMUR_12869 [Listeria grayi FSL F6-1183]|uniref:Uncharacterized protein n=1 Tax=Listeria grayi FSL F6-1183 TaxID=1265827 RepID=A0A829R5S5_LISGR|nr:hypothetical protein LMUR_12869 [Listeria grayi FSL F6-1183]